MEDLPNTPTPLRNDPWPPSQQASVSDAPPGSPRIYDAYHDITYSLPALSNSDTIISDANVDIPLQPTTQEWGTMYKSLEPRWRLDYMDFSPDSPEIPGLAEKYTSFR